jgi:hypothetical protein
MAFQPSLWNGVFTDGFLGGEMHVCVSSIVNNGFLAQAVISHAGYMAGRLEGANWSGQYFLAGEDAPHGTFSLDLDGDSVTGTFTPAGYLIGGSVESSRISSSTPADKECFRADPIMFAPDRNFGNQFEGRWAGGVDNWNINFDKPTNRVTGSYHYDTEERVFGYERGTVYQSHSHVASTSFFEGSDARGVDLLVLKNENEFYATYWAIPSMSAFNYSTVDTADHVQDLYARRVNKDQKVDRPMSEKHICLLSDYKSREICVEGNKSK